ncbi:uncharacterized protein LOC129773085 [Toxorhynchites rutilus septentrionalis]|uniref:uncharacterized protein LOC129773085 n=1 Tax=Toxorhynchites rutilus septentrionalis TaxID=329112 RepID=UPI00247A6673|nr:uncharacterized protein LOC129773085 [Toxorhynchites rutilus septentrionalis]
MIKNWKAIVCTVVATLVVGRVCATNQTDSEAVHHARFKRWLTFYPNGGAARIVLAGLFPIRFHHNTKRNINTIYNLQTQYLVPAKIIWPLPESYFKNRLNNDYVDNSRGQLYQTLEKILENMGQNGRECILKMICEVAGNPVGHNGMLGEILDVVFTPSDAEVMDDVYKQARIDGSRVSDCAQTYNLCPVGDGLLERFSMML